MEADFSIELGRDDPALELPWAGEHGIRYYDLKRHPELIAKLEEPNRYPELGEFLSFINSPASPLESAKCDAWASTDISAEEEIFGAGCKFGSYVDIAFSDEELRFSFPEHELLVKRMVELLKRVPDIPAAAEFIVRRCYYHQGDESDSRAGFYLTENVFGFAHDEQQARQQWGIALKIVENAFRQVFAAMRS